MCLDRLIAPGKAGDHGEIDRGHRQAGVLSFVGGKMTIEKEFQIATRGDSG
jgi:hypothetical protein